MVWFNCMGKIFWGCIVICNNFLIFRFNLILWMILILYYCLSVLWLWRWLLFFVGKRRCNNNFKFRWVRWIIRCNSLMFKVNERLLKLKNKVWCFFFLVLVSKLKIFKCRLINKRVKFWSRKIKFCNKCNRCSY